MRDRSRTTRSGTAMGEMVLVLPLLFVILALLLYFGRGVVRVQHAQVMDRYEAWRQAAGAPGPAVGTGNDELNQLFFGSSAASINYDGSGWFPSQAADDLVDAAVDRQAPNEYRVSQLVRAAISQSDNGRTVGFATRHSNTVPLLGRFAGPIRHGHTRIGHDWAHVNGWSVTTQSGGGLSGTSQWNRAGPYGPNILAPVRDIHYPTFDADLAAIGNPLAEAIRGIYLSRPGYGGPDVEE